MMNKIIAVILAVATFFILRDYETRSYPELAELILPSYASSIPPQQGASRALLDEDERQLYDLIKSSVLKSEEKILIKRLSYSDDDMRRVIWCVVQDSPDIFWVDWANWTVSVDSAGAILLRPVYIFAASELEERGAELQAALDEAVAAASGAQTDYEKALFVHDYLTEAITYDENGGSAVHSVYGALVDKVAVCDGYAHAYRLILGRLGVECMYVEGYIKDRSDVGHAWNIVKIDGVYSHVDATWDDQPVRDEDVIWHGYFLISDEEIYIDHVQANPLELPKCEGYGYYEKLGLRFDTISEATDAVAQALYDNIKAGKNYVEFKLTDPGEAESAARYEAVKGIYEKVNTLLFGSGSSLRVTLGKSIPLDRGHVVLMVTVE
jgi:hypothetical protein